MEHVSLIEKYGSPLYVYDAGVIRARCAELKLHFPDFRLYYACKANTNPEIVRLIAEEGFDIETVSPGEVKLATSAGVPPSRIAFTCGSIGEKELISVVSASIAVHLDSLTQVEIAGKNFPGSEISVRLNQGIGAGHHEHVITGGPDSKFGIDITHLAELDALCKTYDLKVAGLHQHIGSNILDADTFLQAMDVLFETAKKFPLLRHMDFGGGFGVPYHASEHRLDVAALGREVMARKKKFIVEFGSDITMSFEPGRYLVAESGTLLVTVTDIKRNPTKTFVGVDSGMGHLIRPAMYDSYHAIENLTHPENAKESVTIAGYYCESGDVLAKDREIPMPDRGDTLAIRNAGAYGYVMSSDYNLRERPAEVLMDKSDIRLIRERV